MHVETLQISSVSIDEAMVILRLITMDTSPRSNPAMLTGEPGEPARHRQLDELNNIFATVTDTGESIRITVRSEFSMNKAMLVVAQALQVLPGIFSKV